jgi:hypothetical protein
MRTLMHAAVVSGLLYGVHSANAATAEGRWAVTLLAEPALVPRGVIHGDSTGQIADLGSLNSSLAGVSAATALNRIHFRDALAVSPGVSLELGYAATDDLVPYAQLRFSRLRGRDDSAGTITAENQLLPTNITANFNDWKSVELNVGAKYYIVDGVRMRPYFGAYVGANRSDSLSTDISGAGLQVDLGSKVLLPGATRFDAGFSSGVSCAIAPSTDILFQVGGDYVDAQRSQSAAFAPLGVGSVTVGDRRWALSAVAGISYSF